MRGVSCGVAAIAGGRYRRWRGPPDSVSGGPRHGRRVCWSALAELTRRHARSERRPLAGVEEQRRLLEVLRVPHRHPTAGQERRLDAVVVAATGEARLEPSHLVEVEL